MCIYIMAEYHVIHPINKIIKDDNLKNILISIYKEAHADKIIIEKDNYRYTYKLQRNGNKLKINTIEKKQIRNYPIFKITLLNINEQDQPRIKKILAKSLNVSEENITVLSFIVKELETTITFICTEHNQEALLKLDLLKIIKSTFENENIVVTSLLISYRSVDETIKDVSAKHIENIQQIVKKIEENFMFPMNNLFQFPVLPNVIDHEQLFLNNTDSMTDMDTENIITANNVPKADDDTATSEDEPEDNPEIIEMKDSSLKTLEELEELDNDIENTMLSPDASLSTDYILTPVIENKELVAEVKPAPIVEVKPAPIVEVKPAPIVEVKQEPVIETKFAPIVEIKPAPAIEVKQEPVVETKLAPIVEVKPAPVIETKLTPIVEVKPAPVVETKLTPIVEVKPAPVVETKLTPIVEVKPAPVVETKFAPIVEIKPIPVQEVKLAPIVEVKQEPVIVPEVKHQPKIINNNVMIETIDDDTEVEITKI